MEGLTELGHCTPDLRTLKSGEQVWDLTTDVEFDVDPESAAMIEDMELEAMIRRFDQGYTPSGIAGGYKWYAGFGALILAPSQVSKHDEVLRRTAFKDRLGLTLNYDVSLLLEQSVEFKDLPPDAKQAWKPQHSVAEKVALPPPAPREMRLFDDVFIDDEDAPAEAPGT